MVALTAADDSMILLLKYWQNHNLNKAFFWIKKNLKCWGENTYMFKESVMEESVIYDN